jgi:hypothetical protein
MMRIAPVVLLIVAPIAFGQQLAFHRSGRGSMQQIVEVRAQVAAPNRVRAIAARVLIDGPIGDLGA